MIVTNTKIWILNRKTGGGGGGAILALRLVL